MRRRFGCLISLGCCLLCVSLQTIPAQAQLKDMPSQAEFDPILENADKKLKDFASTLTEFRAEATALDRDRLADDLRSIGDIQKIIQTTHGGATQGNGINLTRALSIVTGLDDMAMDAGVWKESAELEMCKQLIQKEDATRQSQFGMRVNLNREMLREVSNQLFHPTFRMAGAADEILVTLSSTATKAKSK